MKKVFIISMLRLGMVAMALFFTGFVVVYFLEVEFEISHGAYNLGLLLLTTLFIGPLIITSFIGVAFFNKKIDRYKEIFTIYQ
jgi:hypothetical protein